MTTDGSENRNKLTCGDVSNDNGDRVLLTESFSQVQCTVHVIAGWGTHSCALFRGQRACRAGLGGMDV